MALRCRLCASEDGASASLTESNGVVYHCLACNGPCIDTDALGILTDDAPAAGGQSRRNPFELRLPDQATATSRKAPTGAPLTTTNVVRLARARIRAIKVELRDKAKLEKELAELERLVSAAITKKKATATSHAVTPVVALKGKAS